MAAGTVAVSEASEKGEVPVLVIDNGGDLPVLLVEGEEVRGGKQNRMLRGSVLAAKGRTLVPVACTQRGRWDHGIQPFAAGTCCPPSLRRALKDWSAGRQSRMWANIRQYHWRLVVNSPSENMSDSLDTHRGRVEALRRQLPYVEGASGIVVAIGPNVCIDIFDRPSTLEKLWDRLAEGCALDAINAKDDEAGDSRSSVELYMETIRNMRWQPVETVGLGEAYRAAGDGGSLATALVAGDTLVHLSVSMQG